MRSFKNAIYCLLLLFPMLIIANRQITNKTFKTLELYQATAPYQEGYLQVSDLHKLYYAQFGNPNGLPVLFLHGGPGIGCHAKSSALFDPSYYRVIMIDQRGAGRSQPFAEIQENQSDLLVQDMETLRKHLNIDKWLLFGGSWGSALAILYGETHPEHILGFVLRGIFLARQHDYEHLFYGVRQFFPELWQSMVESFSTEEQKDLITTLHNKIMNPDSSIHLPIARSFMHYDDAAGTFKANPDTIPFPDDAFALCVTKLFMHYSINNFFLTHNQLLRDIHKINHLPVIIIQGRYDMICPPQTAYDLYTHWDNAQLWFIPEGGHFISDPSIARGLREALDIMKTYY